MATGRRPPASGKTNKQSWCTNWFLVECRAFPLFNYCFFLLAVAESLDEMLRSTFFCVQKPGPTSFVIKRENGIWSLLLLNISKQMKTMHLYFVLTFAQKMRKVRWVKCKSVRVSRALVHILLMKRGYVYTFCLWWWKFSVSVQRIPLCGKSRWPTLRLNRLVVLETRGDKRISLWIFGASYIKGIERGKIRSTCITVCSNGGECVCFQVWHEIFASRRTNFLRRGRQTTAQGTFCVYICQVLTWDWFCINALCFCVTCRVVRHVENIPSHIHGSWKGYFRSSWQLPHLLRGRWSRGSESGPTYLLQGHKARNQGVRIRVKG